MPIDYARRLSGSTRSAQSNSHLGFALAFVAGAANAGGYLAVQQYTSHMTGIVSSVSDHLVLKEYQLMLGGVASLLSFLCGAVCTGVLVNFARERNLSSEYALPLLMEATLLLAFGIVGAKLYALDGFVIPATVMLLCFIMGLQNSVVTKLSNAEIRTTHVTGIVTDIGLELGKLLSAIAERPAKGTPVSGSGVRLAQLSTLLTCFFFGGVLGALGFKSMGHIATVPLALILAALAGVPVIDDLVAALGRSRSNR